jgi:hypothetical protein
MKAPRIVTKTVLNDEAAMRAFYKQLGLSPRTMEAAIQARRNNPIVQRSDASLILERGGKRSSAKLRLVGQRSTD